MDKLIKDMSLEEALAQDRKITLSEAESLLKKANSLQDLANIVNKTKATLTFPQEGANYVYTLFAGKEARSVLEDALAPNVVVVGDNTDVGYLINSQEFNMRVRDILKENQGISLDNGISYLYDGYINENGSVRQRGVELDANGKSLGITLSDGSRIEPFWDIASRNFVLEAPANAEFKMFVSHATSDTTLMTVELPAVWERLNNGLVTTINGVEYNTTTQKLFDNCRELRAVIMGDAIERFFLFDFKKDSVENFVNIQLGSQTKESIAELIKNNPDGLFKSQEIIGKNLTLTEDIKSYVIHLSDKYEKQGLTKNGIESGFADVGLLKGIAGAGLSGVFASLLFFDFYQTAQKAANASSDREAMDILLEWEVKVSATALGAIALDAVVLFGAALLNVPNPIAKVIGFGVALAGGFLINGGVKDIYDLMGDRDANHRPDILDSLISLFVPEGNPLSSFQPGIITDGTLLKIEKTDPASMLVNMAMRDTDEALAWRYALKEMNSFVMIGADYSVHNKDNSLSLYNPETGEGIMTEEFIKARAEMLIWKTRYLSGDKDYNDIFNWNEWKPTNQEWDSLDVEGNWDYVDYKYDRHTLGDNKLTLAIDGTGISQYDHQVVFGYDGYDYIKGSGDTDSLFGGAGNDTLLGYEGDDYLEGGLGNDSLDGGDGDDTLRGISGRNTLIAGEGKDHLYNSSDVNGFDYFIVDREDIIYNNSGNGGILLKTPDGKSVVLTGGYRLENDFPNYWVSDDHHRYSFETEYDEKAKKMITNGNLIVDDYLIIKNFLKNPENVDPTDLKDVEEQLGIKLQRKKSESGKGEEDGAPDISGAEKIISPIILDLNNNGIETKKYGEGAYFDHDGNGLRESTAWVAGGDGLLVRDLNNNGKIDDGSELFGNYTHLNNGKNASNGFEALAELDENKDGRIDKNDSTFNSLLVWQDLNGNGTTEQGELKTLTELGIASIDTAYTNSDKTDANGNKHQQQGSITFDNGTKANATDVWFQVDSTRRIESDHIQLSDDILALPNAKGFGNVHDLREAMMLDPKLKTMVEDILAETDPAKRSDLLDGMIYRWTGVEKVDPHSRDNSSYGHVMDARQLEALEELVGRDYLGTWCSGNRDPNPHGQASSELIAEYRKFKNYTEAQLLVQNDTKLINDVVESLFSGSGRTSFIVNWQALNTKLTGLVALGETEKALEIITLLDHLGVYTSSYQAQKQQLIQSGSEFGNLLKELHGSPNIYVVTDASWGTVLNADGTTEQGRIDIIRFGSSISAEDIQVTRNNRSLILTHKTTGQTIELSNYFYYQGDTTVKATAEIQFVQATGIESWYLEQIKTMALQDTGGNDTLIGYEVDNKIDGGLGNDLIYGGSKNDLLMGGAGNDTIYGGGGNDSLMGGDGNDILYSGNGDNTLMGGDGNDSIYVSWGNNFIIGGAGNDYLFSGNGFDTYEFSRGWGNDTVTAGSCVKYGQDIISFTSDIQSSDILVGRRDNALILKLKGSNDQIYIDGYFARDIYVIQFADGSRWEQNKIKEWVLMATEGNDSIQGSEINDLLHGGAGHDTLTGGLGDDTLYGDTGNDKLYGQAGNDVLFGGEGEDTLEGGDGDDTLYGEEGNDSLLGGNGNDVLYGGNGNDTLYGGDGDNTLSGGNGDDQLWGGDGNNVLNGGAGNDNLYGGAGNCTLDGGTGNDYLSASDRGHNRTFRFALGWGADTISADSYGEGYTNIIEFDQGITTENITISQNKSYSLVIRYKNSNDVIYVEGVNKQLELKFADGTILDWTAIESSALLGTDEDNYIQGFGQGNILNGFDGNDTLIGGYLGDNTLYGGAGNDSLIGMSGNNTLYGGIGNDTLISASGTNNTLVGGEGNDYLESNAKSNTTFVFDRGFGDDTIKTSNIAETNIIQFGEGINPEDLILTDSKSGKVGLIIELKGSNDSILITGLSKNDYKIDGIHFANGTQWNSEDIKSHSGLDIDNTYGRGAELKGAEGNDTITGGSYNDTLIGGGGNDSLYGGEGTNTYLFEQGWGQDTIDNTTTYRASYTDIIKFGEGIQSKDILVSQQENGVLISIKGRTDTLLINRLNLFYPMSTHPSYPKTNQIQFADGTIWDIGRLKQQAMLGTEGNDIIYGTDQNDTITAGKGNDLLYITGGSDTYQFGLSSGRDTLSQENSSYGEPLVGKDTLKLIDGITSQDISLSYQGQDLIINFNASSTDQITVKNYFTDYNKIEGILFSDGSRWNQQDILHHLPSGTLVTPDEWGNMTGGFGNDTLISGEGDNYLSGGDGSDSYLFNQGWGSDTIDQYNNTKQLSSTDQDTLYFGEGISAEDIVIERNDYYTLTLYDKNNPANSINISGYFDQRYNQVNQIQFADGTLWSKDLIDQKANQGKQVIGTEEDDYLAGGFGSDTILGNGGNDYLVGENGSEMYTSGIRKDYLDGGVGDDTLVAMGDQNTLIGGEGNDQLESTGSYNTLDTGDGNNTVDSRGSHNLITGGNEADTITSNAIYDYNGNPTSGYNTIFGLGGDDQIIVIGDQNYVDGGEGNDMLMADMDSNNTTLIGGLGDDQLDGGNNTVYQFDTNWGNDTINNWSDINAEVEDRIAFTQSMDKEKLIFTQEDQDLLISEGNNSIRVTGYFDENVAKVAISFNDGTVWRADDIQQRLTQSFSVASLRFTAHEDTASLASLENQTNNLISAMSSFAAASAAETIPMDQANQSDQLLIAVNQ